MTEQQIRDGNDVLAREADFDSEQLRNFVQGRPDSSTDMCFQQVVEAIADSVVIHRNGRVIYANPSAVRIIGAETLDDLIGQPSLAFVAPKDRQRVGEAIAQVTELGGTSGIVPYTGINFDGDHLEIETIAVRIANKGVPTILNVCRDVTERKRTEKALQESEARFQILAGHSPEAIIAVCERRIILANVAAAVLLGVEDAADLEGRSIDAFSLEEEHGSGEDGLDILERGGAVTRQLQGRFGRGDGLAIDLEITSIPYANGDKPAAYLILRDVTERLRDEERHRYLARHDPLTGLPNRLEFQRRLRVLLTDERGGRSSRFAIHFLDLDHFKNVNDSLGHQIGDRLLQIVAARLRGVIRSTDLVARLGGDEFAVLQGDALHEEAPRLLAEKLQNAIEQPYTIGDQLLHTSASIGIVVCPDHGDDPDELLRRVDLALYHAKSCGRNEIRYFSEDLDLRVRARDQLINQLIRAEAEGEFEVYFQPIASLSSGRIDAVEALLRWNHPERGVMTADSFIHAIESSREGQRVGAWVLREACRHLKMWQRAGIDDLRVAVNLSMPFLQRPDFADLVLEVVREADVDASKLELELTERIIISAGAAGIASKLASLREAGVRIALDDFGTGLFKLVAAQGSAGRSHQDRPLVRRRFRRQQR